MKGPVSLCAIIGGTMTIGLIGLSFATPLPPTPSRALKNYCGPEKYRLAEVTGSSSRARRLFKKAVQQGRSEQRGEEVQTALRVGRSPIEWILANGKAPPVIPISERLYSVL